MTVVTDESLLPRIGLPIHKLKVHYDAVVVGSGYGGAIAASRLARAGKRVCLLERGQERWPGEYPESTADATLEVQFNTEHEHIGKKTGLYEVHKNKDQWAFVACGLGGTSLLNANTALKPDPRVFDKDCWPVEFRNNKALLDESYNHAHDMLQPNPYPEDWPTLPKLATLETMAKGVGQEDLFVRPPITVQFQDRMNPAGVIQKKSTLTGNDTTGINDWSKNTTLMNYIPDAWNHGAEIFTCCNVVSVEKSENKENVPNLAPYIVHFEWQDEGREEFADEHDTEMATMFVTADIVVLGAGALGSSEILLRSVQNGLPVSKEVGRHFSGNGDFLAFSYNGENLVNGVSMGDDDPKEFKKPVGPVITGLIDRRNTEDVMDGYVVEEGAIPSQAAVALQPIYKIMSETTSAKLVSAKDLSIQEKVTRGFREVASTVAGRYHGSMSHTQTFLVMSHDDARGELELRNDRVRINWPDIGSSRNFSRLDELLEPLATSVRGTYVRNPLSVMTDDAIVTVHPIGGCSMADSADKGVTNHKGQVYTGNGSEVHEGLYVMDGAIMPMSLGVNPFFTISALAERACTLMAQDHGWALHRDAVTRPIDYKTPQFPNGGSAGAVPGLSIAEPTTAHALVEEDEENRQVAGHSGTIPAAVSHFTPDQKKEHKKLHRVGVTFTELLKGHISTKILTEDFEAADHQGRSSGSVMTLVLSLETGPIEQFLARQGPTAGVAGTVSCRALSDQALMIEDGEVAVYKPLATDPSSRHEIQYRMTLVSTSGVRFRFVGIKPVKRDDLVEGWTHDTEVLVSVYKVDPQTNAEHLFGRGKLGKSLGDFFTEMTTVRGDSKNFGANLLAMADYSVSTIRSTAKTYLPFLNELKFPEDTPARQIFAKKRPEPKIYDVLSKDGFKSKLTHYKGTKGPVLLIHGASVSSEIFATQLITYNLCDYLLDHGYDVWLEDWRMSIVVEDSHRQSPIWGGMFDHAAAINIVRQETGCQDIQVVAHCVGSLTLFAGLLSGEIEGVGALVGSQVATTPMLSTANKIKQQLQLVPLFEKVLKQEEFNCTTYSPKTSEATLISGATGVPKEIKVPKVTLLDRAIDTSLRFMPVPAHQGCDNAICHRSTFCYGLLWQHENLIKNMHDHLEDIIGSTNVTALRGLVMEWTKKSTLTLPVNFEEPEGETIDLVTGDNMRKAFSHLPTLLIHGAKNAVFIPESTAQTIDKLREAILPKTGMAFDTEGLFRRQLIEGYGHLDCILGENAHKDVYPYILEHLERNVKTVGYGRLQQQ